MESASSSLRVDKALSLWYYSQYHPNRPTGQKEKKVQFLKHNSLWLALACLALSTGAFKVAVQWPMFNPGGAMAITGIAFLFAAICAAAKFVLDVATPTSLPEWPAEESERPVGWG